MEEARSAEVALLRNIKGERFMPGYHPMAELAPRDVVARCIFKEMQDAGSDHVWLDATVIDHAANIFPMIARTCKEYGVDIETEYIPIAPAAHYMMGGVHTDEHGRTNIAGLYAAGETACTGLQGANRLASNSLLEGLVFGRRTADDIVEKASPSGRGGREADGAGLRKNRQTTAIVAGNVSNANVAVPSLFSPDLYWTSEGLRTTVLTDTDRLTRDPPGAASAASSLVGIFKAVTV